MVTFYMTQPMRGKLDFRWLNSQDWTINKFNGIVRIHSGNGLVIVDKDGIQSRVVNKILGTLASFVVTYN